MEGRGSSREKGQGATRNERRGGAGRDGRAGREGRVGRQRTAEREKLGEAQGVREGRKGRKAWSDKLSSKAGNCYRACTKRHKAPQSTTQSAIRVRTKRHKALF